MGAKPVAAQPRRSVLIESSMSQSIFDLQHVNVARGETTVLHDINLTLHPGQHLAILGPNGCGKSTLLKTITCELYPIVQPGTSVSIFGRSRWDLTELKKRLGVVSAELPGRPTLHTTGFDSLLTGFFSASTLWPNLTVTAAMRDRAEEILHLVDAVNLRSKPVGEMSAGQQRRIMIGRALVGSGAALSGHGSSSAGHAPDIATSTPTAMLLLDEPSNALDLSAQRDLRDLLRRLASAGVTILLITHHIADIIPEINRILMMREGRIVADGPRSELLTAQRLSELFRTEVQLTERNGFQHAW